MLALIISNIFKSVPIPVIPKVGISDRTLCILLNFLILRRILGHFVVVSNELSTKFQQLWNK